MSEIRLRLEAGGLTSIAEVPPSDLPIDAVPMDTVDARGYTSPALPGRVVVRLVPDAIALGIDTEMSLMSFALTTHANDIARQRRRALGFPGTALVMDPEHARYALDVMREWKTHAKKIQSKPGHAKEGFDEIGARLERQVPHFLPSYYEEVARAFANGGNMTYAASAFDKARAAEREFGLEVDEERRAEAFLEFSLLGALTVKSIQAYGKEVARLAGPKVAYERMYALAVRRTLGGVAPWASLPKDLRSLAKSAKLDVAAEDRRFLKEISGGTALKRAPASFWAEYRDAWVELAKEPAMRSKLLDFFPNGGKARYSWRNDDDGFTDVWMTLLAESGALDILWTEGPADALPAGGRTAWFERYQGWSKPGDGWILPMARRSRARLLADGVPFPIAAGGWYDPVDLDLVDLLVELGIPWKFAADGGHRRYNLEQWAQGKPSPARHGFPAEHRPRDPVHAGPDPEIQRGIGAAIDGVFGNAAFESVAAGMKGMADLRRRWLLDRISELSGPGLASTDYALGRLEAATTPSQFAEFPEALAALDEASVGSALAGTLRAGLFEELHWPAFDAAVASFGGDGTQLGARIEWPYVIVFDTRKAAVVGRDGVVLAHDLKHGDGKAHPVRLHFVGGRLLVCWNYWKAGGNYNAAYWSDQPNDTFTVEHGWYNQTAEFPLRSADAVVLGLGRITAGDRDLPPRAMQFHDRDGAWVLHEYVLHAQDRQTGKPGAKASPGFLQQAGDWSRSRYYPVDTPASPVAGVVDGQYGVRASHGVPVEGGPARWLFTTLSGDEVEAQISLGTTSVNVLALVSLPGTGPRRVGFEQRYHGGRYVNRLLATDPGSDRISLAWGEGGPVFPPLESWHYLVPADPAGSAALRALSSAVNVLGAEPIPGVTHPRLKEAVERARAQGRALQERLDKLREARRGGTAKAPAAQTGPQVTDAEAGVLLSNLQRYWTYQNGSLTTAITTLGDFLVDGETGQNVLVSRMTPQAWVGRIRGVAVSLGRPGLDDAQRRQGATLLRAWAASGFGTPGWRFRTGSLEFDAIDAAWTARVTVDGKTTVGSCWRQVQSPTSRFFFHDVSHNDDPPHRGWFVEGTSDPEWGELHGARIRATATGEAGDDRDWLGTFAAALESRGAWPVTREAVDAFAQATGVTPTDAGVVLAGFPEELDKATREALGLKHAEVKAAAQRLRNAVTVEQKLEVLAARAAGGPVAAWEAPDLAAMAAVWNRLFGRGVAVDEALMLLADRELGRSGVATVTGFANPAGWELLRRTPTTEWDQRGRASSSFGLHDLDGVLVAAAWLAVHLPVGHPLLRGMPAVIEQVRRLVATPGLWFAVDGWFAYEEKVLKVAKAWFAALPGTAKPADEAGNGEVKEVGPTRFSLLQHRVEGAFQPGQLDPTSRDLVNSYYKASGSAGASMGALDTLQSAGFAELVKRAAASPLPEGAWEQDPTRSAPETVAAAAKKLGISAEAAALYLMFLALLDPTRKNVLSWTGWSPKVYDRAAAELVGAGLVVEGKRPRAGREHYLPGGWVDMTPPLEEWKRPLHGWLGERWTLSRPAPIAPIHELFARAWARVAGGDAPKFEEVRR